MFKTIRDQDALTKQLKRKYSTPIHPEKIAVAEDDLGTDAIAWQLSRKGFRKLIETVSRA